MMTSTGAPSGFRDAGRRDLHAFSEPDEAALAAPRRDDAAQSVRLADEARDESRGRPVVDVLRRPELLHDSIAP